MKMVILDGEALNPGDLSWEPIASQGELTVYPRTETEALAAERARDAEILFVNKTPVTDSLLSACPKVRLIIVLATGYNVVDCAAARRRNIPVCNIPAYGTAAVAQFAFALILELVNRVGVHDVSVHRGDWTVCPNFSYWLTPQTELAGKTLGIIGLGRIGQAVAKMGRAFGMEVLAYSRSRSSEGDAVATYVELEELLAKSHIISLHCPLFPQTEKIVCRENIAKMRDGVYLVNTSRGGLIDEEALLEALQSGKIAGAALDVVSTEPIPADHILLSAPNCILTPHMAWAPRESRGRIMTIAAENLRSFLAGTPVNVVN